MKISRVDLEYIAREIRDVPIDALTATLQALIEAIPDKAEKLTLGTPVNAAAASQVFTITPGEDPVISNNIVVSIANIDYTFVDNFSIPAEPYEVLIGDNDEKSLTNLYYAINEGEDGESYEVRHTSTEPNSLVSATAKDNVSITVTAITKGIAGNSIEVSTTMGADVGEWGAATLENGVNGTVGEFTQMMLQVGETNYLWICTAENTITDSNWVKIG